MKPVFSTPWTTVDLVRRSISLCPVVYRALDLCCGTGTVAKLLEEAYPEAEVVGTDIHPFAGRLVGDLFEPVTGMFDLIVCSAPNVPSCVCEAQNLEPREAYDGGKDGFDTLSRVVAGFKPYLLPGGLLAMEISPSHRQHFKPPWWTELDRCGITTYAFYRRPLVIH